MDNKLSFMCIFVVLIVCIHFFRQSKCGLLNVLTVQKLEERKKHTHTHTQKEEEGGGKTKQPRGKWYKSWRCLKCYEEIISYFILVLFILTSPYYENMISFPSYIVAFQLMYDHVMQLQWHYTAAESASSCGGSAWCSSWIYAFCVIFGFIFFHALSSSYCLLPLAAKHWGLRWRLCIICE